jgi:hypothetical protein
MATGGIMLRFISCNAVIFLLGTHLVSFGQVLDVPEVIQEQNEWCWAAVSCCVLSYYGHPVSQCTIADYTRTHATWHNFGTVSCCEDPKKGCNYWNYNYGYAGSIQAILKEWGVENTGTAKSLAIAKMQSELGAGSPFIIRWAYPDGGGHFIVGHGIADSTVYYMNPWFGEGLTIAKYKWMLSTSEHSWAATNVMTTNPSGVGMVTLLSPCDSSINQSIVPNFLWRKVNGASYRFQCAKAASFASPIKDTAIARDTTLRLTGLSPSTVYFWRVRAMNAADTGAWSAIWRFTTSPSTAAVAYEGTKRAVISGHLMKNELSITYNVPTASQVGINVYTLQGELVCSVCSGFHRPGHYAKRFSRVNLSSGNYLLSICAGNYRATACMVYDAGMR